MRDKAGRLLAAACPASPSWALPVAVRLVFFALLPAQVRSGGLPLSSATRGAAADGVSREGRGKDQVLEQRSRSLNAAFLSSPTRADGWTAEASIADPVPGGRRLREDVNQWYRVLPIVVASFIVALCAAVPLRWYVMHRLQAAKACQGQSDGGEEATEVATPASVKAAANDVTSFTSPGSVKQVHEPISPKQAWQHAPNVQLSIPATEAKLAWFDADGADSDEEPPRLEPVGQVAAPHVGPVPLLRNVALASRDDEVVPLSPASVEEVPEPRFSSLILDIEVEEEWC